MSLPLFRRTFGIAGSVLLSVLAVEIITAQQPPRFGGAYSELDARRQQLVDDWVARFTKVTGQSLDARSFYDDILSLSTKTTFDAVTHALMTTPLTDASGQKFGDGLALVERVDTVKGEVSGASGDRQFRMYVRLTPDAREMLERSREFKRGIDNAVYHKGYPLNYREQRGTPSIQVSIAHGRSSGRYRRRLSIVELPRHVVQRTPERVELGRPRRQQRRAARRAVVRVSELVAKLLRCGPRAGRRTRRIRPPRLLCRKCRARARRIST